ncbi:MAG: hypothetical protein HUJ61_05850 [Bacilli bacterium]|nr:hypothetical protein [Bacilli bacterium]
MTIIEDGDYELEFFLIEEKYYRNLINTLDQNTICKPKRPHFVLRNKKTGKYYTGKGNLKVIIPLQHIANKEKQFYLERKYEANGKECAFSMALMYKGDKCPENIIGAVDTGRCFLAPDDVLKPIDPKKFECNRNEIRNRKMELRILQSYDFQTSLLNKLTYIKE